MASPAKNGVKEGARRAHPPPGGEALRQEIALRAYHRYCERGRIDGFDVDDWLAAERELLQGRAAKPARSSSRWRPAAGSKGQDARKRADR